MSDYDFPQLTGHQPNLAALRSGGRRQPFPSLIFSGPTHVGKRLTGVWYAAFLNCLAADENAPCGECPACKKVLRCGHPDVHFATVPDNKTVIGVAEIREAVHQLQYAPFEGNFRVLVVENAEKLTDEAQNALLKTLEEPPSKSIIILVTPLFGALIPTVVSRCRAVRFGLLGETEVISYLASQGVESSQAQTMARLCRGALGVAVSLGSHPEEMVQRDEAIELFTELPGRDLWGATDTALRLEKLKVGSLEQLLELGASVYRDLLVLAGGCPDLVCHEKHLSRFQARLEALTSQNIRRLLRTFSEAQQHRVANVSPKILLQRLCVVLSKGGQS